ncbi:hypothetical protein PHSY_000721 [Pseudozyma hubeiensis SY62]|uniref:Uncharacterized protein n=1 Tax=Pseudozyma hubeiensis (strain SY62) TaxID=1305764 RepID=R9NWZ6_PSEHS|nr:hypothetical protein PHSY_000721 [Pseudozyma hubeiensis SY62]GAC93158.1 hypothetical protein PHSY_000721 [Pseudozyma hubeiensis SY62]
MHFTQALTVALSLSAAAVKAAPLRTGQETSSKLALRSVHESQIAARGIDNALSSQPIQARGLDSVTHLRRAIDVHFGHLDPQARDLALVTELHRRGLLDQLVAALRDLIITLLGKGGGMSRRQASTDQLEQAIHQVTCILDALFGNTDNSCSDVFGGATNATNATGAATAAGKSPVEKKLAALGAQLRNATSITQAVDGLMAHNVTAVPKQKGDKKADKKAAQSSTTTTAAAAQKRSFESLEARQSSGVEGLLVALRDVVDTILNTLLPMASRGNDDTTTSTSSARWPPQDCPPPTPNDGMYRPGCPGYGRRDLAVRRSMDALGERDANILQSVLPMIEMLLQQLPQLIQSMSSSPTSSAANSAATAASATGSAKGASPTDMVDNAFSQIMSALGYADSPSPSQGSSSAGKASATSSAAEKASATGISSTDGASSAARSAANLSQNFARDLLNGDGMNLGKRQTANPTGTTDDGSIGSDNCDASGNSGGINVSLLNNLLNGLLSGFGRRSEEYVPVEFFKRQTTGVTGDDGNAIGSGNCSASDNSGGINVSLLDNLLNGLLSGFGRRDVSDGDNASDNHGGINISLLNNLLNGLLSGHQRRDIGDGDNASNNHGGINISLLDNLLNGLLSGAARRDVGSETAAPLEARADFAPVWKQIKALGNEHFHSARDVSTDEPATKRAADNTDAPNFTPVWEAFRDLVDSGYEQAAAHTAGAERRDAASLKLDYKPLMKAGVKFGKQVFKSFTTHHAKRSTDYKPFVDAASNFAVTAIKEMFHKA